jgi:hypothetical protein
MGYMDDRNYNRAESIFKWGRRLLLICAGLVLAGVCYWVYAQVQTELQMRQLVGQVVNLLNYNIQSGGIKVPPPAPTVSPLAPPAEKPDAAPAPAPAPKK